MENGQFLWDLFWIAALLQIVMTDSTTNNTTTMAPTQMTTAEPSSSGYAWSVWGRWSPCSRTCGGGVSVQERQCLPRPRNLQVNSNETTPVLTVRVTRQINKGCLGVDRRYHECNTQPCAGGVLNTRAEQCSSFDRRPFRGRFYTWIPYVDGNAPCALNCRPMGQQFYATLSIVDDGTPCTQDGLPAICVQGTCKVIGRESVLAGSNSRELRCGRRLVSGLFSKPRLPLGYTFVATVPRGACRINVTELASSENYIALRLSNSSYILNGEFAVSAPGMYEAAGARFLYTRTAGLDNVHANGPIYHPIDIMILYTQPKPNIKYEYFTDSPIDEGDEARPEIPDVVPAIITKHTRRHHSFDAYPRATGNIPRHLDHPSTSNEQTSVETGIDANVIGNRKFMWRILSFTQCTRSCGGGIQLGKYRCVESTSSGDREVSSVHCTGSPPIGRRRRCGNVPCPPRWRAASWSPCPRCGPATRTRIVGCVQDHSKGITKISDHKCPPPKPPTTEMCNIPNCDDLSLGPVRRIESKRTRNKELTDTFREGPVYTVSINTTESEIGPEYSFNAAAGWLYTEWSECIGWCVGGGVQTRGVRCTDPSGCAPRKEPQTSRSCSPALSCESSEGQWFTGDWSRCTSKCKGRQIRGVLCIGGTGRHLRDSACKDPKPDHVRECGADCPPTWYFSDWGKCTGNCTSEVGLQTRSVICAHPETNGTGGEADCKTARPHEQKSCEMRCPTISTLPPDLTIESQKVVTSSNRPPIIRETGPRECEDKLNNCFLAVQARLCHYNFYVQNCCNSCKGL
ncbi:thrombospondin type-1 domain-containing protein 4 isoform X2 [Bombyx mori]|uniref:PLAC domain-containing protein n=1 Tax=Bombyx mori TaxID=7091 RepID=A0A8R2GEJ1_BOMMO|nr:thrombospondin type-1 domain-containing protein 4 isoform X2 [Bombyx mori]